jgi:hypothetical protein
MSNSMNPMRNQRQTTFARALSWGGAAGHFIPGFYCDIQRSQLGLWDTRIMRLTDGRQHLVGWIRANVTVPTVKSP